MTEPSDAAGPRNEPGASYLTESREVEALRARVADLEAKQAPGAVAPGRAAGRARSAFAWLLITVAAILAPVAVLGSWARAELVDTERFVQTFAPLAQEPEVQAFVTQQVVEAIDENVDIDGTVGDLLDGLSELGLPPDAQNAVVLLKGPAAAGVKSLIGTSVEGVVASEQFAQLWQVTLRETHSRAIGVIQGDPNTALQLSDDGTLSIELGTVITQVKGSLVGQGFGFAQQIPVVEKSIPVLASDSLILVRVLYQVAVSAGYWLPWVVLALIAIGLTVARNRTRALAWTGASLAVSFGLLAAGLGIGRGFFIGTVSPSVMPGATAGVLFDQLTAMISAVLLALITLSVFIAIGAWFYGTSRPARAFRAAGDRVFAAVRASFARNGLNTGGFGRAVERWRSAIIVATAAIGVIFIFLNRPTTLGSVIGTAVVVLLVILLVEILRRPAQTPQSGKLRS